MFWIGKEKKNSYYVASNCRFGADVNRQPVSLDDCCDLTAKK